MLTSEFNKMLKEDEDPNIITSDKVAQPYPRLIKAGGKK